MSKKTYQARYRQEETRPINTSTSKGKQKALMGNGQRFAQAQQSATKPWPTLMDLSGILPVHDRHIVDVPHKRTRRFLHQSTREIPFAYEDEVGDDVIASLDFWGRPQSPQAQVK